MPLTERCMVPILLSVVETVKFTGSIDLLNVMEIVLLTETSVAPSAEETAETVGAEVSAIAIVASSSSLGESTGKDKSHNRQQASKFFGEIA